MVKHVFYKDTNLDVAGMWNFGGVEKPPRNISYIGWPANLRITKKKGGSRRAQRGVFWGAMTREILILRILSKRVGFLGTFGSKNSESG